MKFKLLFCLLIACCQTGFSTPPSKKSPKFRIIHNNDGTDALSNNWFDLDKPLAVSDINNYVDMVSGSQVTTFMMNTGSDFVYYKSKYARTFCDDLDGKLVCNSKPETVAAWKKYHRNIKNLEAEGTDVIAASLNRAKKNGLEAIVTFRMNDLHFADTTQFCTWVYPDFWIQNPQFWLGKDAQGYNSSNALNFKHDAVRQYKLNLIHEQIEKYDMMDGFDLDFMRFAVFFKPEEAQVNAHLITEMLQNVRRKLDAEGKKRGKRLTLSVRVPITIEGCLQKGLDVKKWASLGLIDFISIGAHWPGETATPVAKFKAELNHPKIPVYGTIDAGGYTPFEFYTHGMYKGMASHLLNQGDGIHLFNYYFDFYKRINKEKIVTTEGGLSCRYAAPSLLKELGSLKTLENRNKIFCASDGTTPAYRVLQVTDLPMGCGRGKKSNASIFVGDNTATSAPKEVILFIRNDRKAPFEVEINGNKLTVQKTEYPAQYDRQKGLLEGEQMYAYVVPAMFLKHGENLVSIMATGGIFMTKRLEIALKYGEVDTHGYF